MRTVVDGFARRVPAQSQTQRYMRVVLAVGLLALGLWIIHNFLSALIWASILVIALWPSYSRACRAWPGGRRVGWPAIFTTISGLVIIVPLVLLGFQAAREAHDVLEFIHNVERTGIAVPSWVAHLPFGAAAVEGWWTKTLASPFDTNAFIHRIDRGSLVSVTREYGAQFVHRIVTFAFTLLTLFFLFRDGPKLSMQLLDASRSLFGARGEQLARQIVASVHGTVDGLVLVGIGEGVAMGIAYFFTGVPHPVLFGAITAVAAMIPFGAAIAFGIASLILVAQGSVGLAVFVFVLGLAVVGVADHLIRPAVIGGATELPFVWVLLGILGGVETFGLLGLFLGPAVMSALILLWRELVAKPMDQAAVTSPAA